MRQTDKYNLNIIETFDPFGPEALNQNTEAIEAQLAAKADDAGLAAETAAREALAGRVGTLERTRLVCKSGNYTGNGQAGSSTPTRLTFDFKPIALIIWNTSNVYYGGHLWIYGMTAGYVSITNTVRSGVNLTWENRAVRWYDSDSDPTSQLNASKTVYYYLAIGLQE